MIKIILSRAFQVLMKKPMRLWGISLLCSLLGGIAGGAFIGVPVVGLCIALLLNVSMTMIYLRGYRGKEVETTQLFECFKDGATIKRVLGGMLWMALWIFLWGLIPVVGGIFAIIRSYEYRLTPYILVMEPEVSATEAIKVSKERTMGYKGKMFGAELLIGVILFAVILVLGILASIPFIGGLFALIAALVYIAAIILLPLFLGLVQAAFYEEITNPTIPAAPTYTMPVYPTMPTGGPMGGQSRFCPNCGTPADGGGRFCVRCGHPLN